MVNTAIKARVVGAETRAVVARANRIGARDRRRQLHNIAKPKDRQTSNGQTSWIRFALAASTEEPSTEATAEVPQVPEENDAAAAPKGGRSKNGRRQQNNEKVREAVANLKEGDMLKGKVRKLESFGAFVDIGVGKDALIHISQLSAKFTKNVEDILDVGQEVEARLLSIDLDSLRIQLSLISQEEAEEQKTREKRKPKQKKKFTPSFKVGEKIVGKIASVRPFGCFVELGENKTGLIHVSEIIDEDSLDSLSDMNLAQGQKIEVVVAEINEKKREYKLRPSAEALQKMIPEEEVYVEENSIPPAMPFFMKEYGVIRSMYPNRPEVSYIPRGVFYKTEKLPTNPDGRSYKVVGSNYSDAANWADVIPSMNEDAPAEDAPAETQAAAVVEEPVKEEAEVEEEAAPEAEEETAAAETEAAAAAEPAAEEKEDEGKKKTTSEVTISAKLVKELRDSSGAGMMDCKKALTECGGDLEKAEEYLRKKGITSAEKKASRIAAEGMVSSYIHAGSRIGVLVEVNCETDFVARGDKFKELVQGLAMQIAASPSVEYVAPEDASAEFVEAEKQAEMQKEDLASKPENIREKIVEGRVEKIINERALLEQTYIMDTTKTVREAITESIASIGENIKVRRFSRYVLGEGIEKKTVDFATEVEQQMKG